jgi:hypothetical protein
VDEPSLASQADTCEVHNLKLDWNFLDYTSSSIELDIESLEDPPEGSLADGDKRTQEMCAVTIQEPLEDRGGITMIGTILRKYSPALNPPFARIDTKGYRFFDVTESAETHSTIHRPDHSWLEALGLLRHSAPAAWPHVVVLVLDMSSADFAALLTVVNKIDRPVSRSYM